MIAQDISTKDTNQFCGVFGETLNQSKFV